MVEFVKFELKMISRLLHYPDEELVSLLPVFRAAMSDLGDPVVRKRYAPVFSHFESSPLIRLQEQYTEVFDLKPAHSLNLTYHCFGDSEKRGPALSHIEEIYHRAGLDRTDGELPDYLPLVLEFIVEKPDIGQAEIVFRYKDAIVTLAERFANISGPYGVLFERLCRIFYPPAQSGDEVFDTAG